MSDADSDLRPPRRSKSLLIGGLLLTLILAAVGWEAYDRRERTRMLEQGVSEQIAKLTQDNETLRKELAELQATRKQADQQLAAIATKVNERDEQRTQVEDMLRAIERSGDDRVLAEIEQLVTLAQQQLSIASDVRGALAALQIADQRASRIDQVNVAPLRKALGQDIDRLRNLPALDVTGIALKLEQVVTQADVLPLLLDTPVLAAPKAPAEKAQPLAEMAWTDYAKSMFTDISRGLKGLVRIRDAEPTDASLIAPSQAYFVRENVKLRLTAARLALLARDENNFKSDVKAASQMLTRYFDKQSRATLVAIEDLNRLAAMPIAITVPDVNPSLAAVRSLRVARERSR